MQRLRSTTCITIYINPFLTSLSSTVVSFRHLTEFSNNTRNNNRVNYSDNITRLFSEGFKGMEEFLSRKPVLLSREYKQQNQSEIRAPSFTDSSDIYSSSLMGNSNINNNKGKPVAKSARELFPDITTLFPDATNATASANLPITGSTVSSKLQSTKIKNNLFRNHYNDNKGTNSQNKNHKERSNSETTSNSYSSKRQNISIESENTKKFQNDAQRYAFAYGLWKQRNEALLQMNNEIKQLANGIQYLREVQDNNLKEGIKNTTRIFLFVVLPFVILISMIFSNETVLYFAELKNLRLIQDDTWQTKNNSFISSSKTRH